MKKTVRFTALLLAVIMILCACNPETNNKLTGKLVIEGYIPWDTNRAEVFIDGNNVGTLKRENLEISVEVGTHKLEMKAYGYDSDKPAYSFSEDIEISALKTTTIKAYDSKWEYLLPHVMLTYDCAEYPGADYYEISFMNSNNYGGTTWYSISNEYPSVMDIGVYNVTAYAYKENTLVAIAHPAQADLTKDKSEVHYTFEAKEWKAPTEPAKNIDYPMHIEKPSNVDSLAVFLNGNRLELNESNRATASLDDHKIHELEIYGFKNGNPSSYAMIKLTPHEDDSNVTHGYSPYEKREGYLAFTYANIPLANRYVFRLDGNPVDVDIPRIYLQPGDHHLEAFAFNGDKLINAKYLDFNITSSEETKIHMDSWSKTLDPETIMAVLQSFNTASYGFNRVASYPLNRLLDQDAANTLAVVLNANIEAVLEGATIVEPIACTVGNETFTATLKFKDDIDNVTMEVTQSPMGAFTIKKTTTTDSGVTFTDVMSYSRLNDYSFKYLKNTSDNVTYVDNCIWEGSNKTETIVAVHLNTKEELAKLLQVNGFAMSQPDWDSVGKEYVKYDSTNSYALYWIRIKGNDSTGYSVTMHEVIK